MQPFTKHAAQQASGSHSNAPLQEKLSQIQTRLKNMQAGKEVGGEGATLGDDAPLPANIRAAIAREETLVRRALKAVGFDYDALIAQEGQEGKTSAYAQAVAANPAVLKQVLASDSPVVAALEVAVNYKPYAEFAAKYGRDPAAIKEAIRAEVLAEMPTAEEPTKAQKALPFSRGSRAQNAASVTADVSLTKVFRK